MVENIFNALSAALELPENQTLFNKAEGIELMVMTLKERKYASRCALRVIDAALSSNGANCERFVDIRGFKTLFPLVRWVAAAAAELCKEQGGEGERAEAAR